MGRRHCSGRTPRRLVVVLVVGVLAIGTSLVWAYAAASRSPAAPLEQPPRRLTAQGNRVLLVGDSLLWAATTPVTDALRAERWEPTIAAAPATTIDAWTGGMAQRVFDTRPDVVVVELGTNDCTGPCPDLAADIDALVRSLPRNVPVLWLDVQTQPSYPTHPETVNRELDAAVKRWPAVTLLGLNARFRDHPEWHLDDGLHFNDAGSAQLAQLIAETLRTVR